MTTWEGVSPAMLQTLVEEDAEKAAAVTPPLNSPHAAFIPEVATREVSCLTGLAPYEDGRMEMGCRRRFLGLTALTWTV